MLRAGLCPGLTEEIVQLLRGRKIKTGDLMGTTPGVGAVVLVHVRGPFALTGGPHSSDSLETLGS